MRIISVNLTRYLIHLDHRSVDEWRRAHHPHLEWTIDAIERSGVRLGYKVERLLPSEFAMYSHPATKLDGLPRVKR
ncbi:hypothetical protein J2S00_003963 [Caldalkalibacillus uzonensis]|uniref:L-rhamnose mutarotase n=1 Tax=Caldalkalibacillus uzonensis TaxID=353224 RepID=A0ABU0CY94_9BACI|nr:hypothetical protein [Caldalkalibacillus uzonensis]MDQ0341119.1 hypothetical protein [Caldalkalibacillus uzonensis]